MVQSYPGHIPVESINRKLCVNCLSDEVIELFPGRVKSAAAMLMRSRAMHADEGPLRIVGEEGNANGKNCSYC
jgi:hypothetical protein